ncbi:hypothetical protein I203_100117 [Kwoniella mangroviensis CBS 8507]|uniref:uncharacterized protein n=1 Tax=Kwoniella mangroviensis CBS 8507 TaxID=1296122 RepID=UPI00080D2B7D|nr:uncharacterized protein I203_07921 [Kwoniella mangroviensis CBS 8507]OCF62942.1 hypothetical protein I203_07921 [Kwoniella mangroviensis CBS 8507]
MSTVKQCPYCKEAGNLQTDFSAGNVVCHTCGQIVEENILVSEVGFAEGSSGRIHIQGGFVAHNQTGFAGVRSGAKGIQNTEGIKQSGAVKIDNVARQMHINNVISGKAKRFYSMAVDNKFNRGRRTEYVVASCLYLACRLGKDAHMLIDFSERLSINVYELGATYLKLRSILHLLEQMPEVDPAIYNLRFAHKLDFGPTVHLIATDASRLVRRFRADWMTQGRRPAGVCGACLIIAARMSNFLRTPDEVAQVVKVHPTTIKKRLLEFAQTEMAKKTVAEWRTLTDEDLDKMNESEKPPVVKKRELQQIKIERLKREQQESSELGSEVDELVNEDERPSKRFKGKGKQVDGDEDEDEDEEMRGMVTAAAHDVESQAEDAEDEERDDEEDEEDDNLEPISQADYVNELELARDNPEESRAERLREKSAFMRQIKNLQKNGNDQIDIYNELELDALIDYDKEEDEDDEDEDENKEEELGEPATQLRSITKEEQDAAAGGKTKKEDGGGEEFKEWENQDAVLDYLAKDVFKGEELLYQGKHMTDRIKMWIGSRDPKTLMEELSVVHQARLKREKLAKVKEIEFEDLDDEELEMSFRLDEDEKQARARIWLSSNGKWLEEEKVRQEERAIALRAKGIDPTKPKPKRKRAAPHKGPYNSSREAIQNFAKGKQFSSRINYDILRGLNNMGGVGGVGGPSSGPSGLMRMNDDKDDEYYEDDKGDEDDNRWDEEKGDEGGEW